MSNNVVSFSTNMLSSYVSMRSFRRCNMFEIVVTKRNGKYEVVYYSEVCIFKLFFQNGKICNKYVFDMQSEENAPIDLRKMRPNEPLVNHRLHKDSKVAYINPRFLLATNPPLQFGDRNYYISTLKKDIVNYSCVENVTTILNHVERHLSRH